MIFFPETWRKERSVVWAKAVKRVETSAPPSKKRIDFDDEFSPGATYVSPTPAQLEQGVDPTYSAPSFEALKAVLSRKAIEGKGVVRVSLKDANVRQHHSRVYSC